MASPVKDTPLGYLIKKGFLLAIIGVIVVALAGSWSFAWNTSAERTKVLQSLDHHIHNEYIHNMEDKLVTEKQLNLYLEVMNQRFDDLETHIKDMKEELKSKK